MLKDNARIDLTRKRLVNELNHAQLPIYVLELIVSEIYTELKRQRMDQVKKEEQEYAQESEAAKREASEKPAPGETLPLKSVKGTASIPLSAVRGAQQEKAEPEEGKEGGS